MMRRQPSKDMAKVTVRMTKAEYQKVIDLSGHLSINSFLMTAVRKAISAAEAERQKEELASGFALSKESPTATAAYSTLLRVTKGDDESNGK